MKLIGVIALTLLVAIYAIFSRLQDKPQVENTLVIAPQTSSKIGDKSDEDRSEKSSNELVVEIKKSEILDSYITKCSKLANPTEENVDNQYLQEIENTDRSDYYKILSDFTINDEQKLKMFLNLNYNDPANNLYSNEIVRICSNDTTINGCQPQLIEKLALETISDAEKWLNIANYYAGKNETDKVLTSIDRVLESTSYNNLHAERIFKIFDEINSKTSVGLFYSVTEALKVSAYNSVNYSALFRFCQNGAHDDYLASRCFELGRDLAVRGKSKSIIINGINLINMISELANFESENVEPPSHYQKYESSKYDEDFYYAINLMKYNDKLLLGWLQNLKQLGELHANMEAVDEVIRLAESENYSGCSN